MERALRGEWPPRLGVAVSGGGDSTALMHLAARWARGRTALCAVTVDHGLRDASAAEAEAVARQAAALGLTHATLRWRWDGTGNLQAAAREGRRRLVREWAAAMGAPAMLLGHTLDDQAETLVMRLARGSGVEGLSGMEEGALDPGWRERPSPGNTPFLRPLLGVPRAALRGWLNDHAIPWSEDPSNEDDRFERVRARRAIAALGLDPARLAATAGRMARARHALELRAHETARALARPCPPGEVRLDRAGLARADADTRLRILAGALRCVAGAAYRPREAELERAAAAALGGVARTLHGCAIRPLADSSGDALLIHREAAAVAGLRAPADGVSLWDGAWALGGPETWGCEVRALGGEGLRRIGARAPDGAPLSSGPRAALAAKPAVWRNDDLVAFGPAGFGPSHALRWLPPGGAFPGCLLTRPGAPSEPGAEPPPAP